MAHRSDHIQIGDRLIAVNGINVQKLKHTDVYTLLKNAGERVRLDLEYSLQDACNLKQKLARTFSSHFRF
jgi:hypothetical protein